MKQCFVIICVLFSFAAKAQKVDSIFFNLYTDSLKKGVHNYINVDGKLTNGQFYPLTSSEVALFSSSGVWDGNSLIIDTSYKKDSVVITAILKEKPTIRKVITIYLKKVETEPELKTTEELMEEWRSKGKKEKKKSKS
jgi:hypothetical protein